MFLDTSVYNTLVADEICLVRSMRQFLFKEDRDRPVLLNHADLDVVKVPIGRLLKILWQYDPLLIDLCRPDDPNVSIFELQLLYTIAARRSGHSTIVDEVLAWWLPHSALNTAMRQLSAIANILDQAGMAVQSIERLQAHILALTSARCRHNRLVAVDTWMPTVGSRVLH